MKFDRLVPAASWLRGAIAFSLLALFLVPGCADDYAPTEPEGTFTQVDGVTPLSVAPDFCPNLPDFPVVAYQNQVGANSLFDVRFWGVGEGYDVEDNWRTGAVYRGWCVEDYPIPNVQDPDRVTLYCTYDDALPGNLADEILINELNYLLNNKTSTDLWDVQVAIWLLLGYETPSKPVTPAAIAMRDDALANGGGFVPGPDQVIAAFLYTGDGGIGPEGFQETIIELRSRGEEEPGGDACTPGYWKTHFSRWPAPYLPTDDFDATFGTDYFDGGMNLGDATWARGGGLNKLARHGTSALLNAVHMDVEYPYTIAEVIEMVRNGDADTLADTNDELDCPLGGTPADPKPKVESRGGKKK